MWFVYMCVSDCVCVCVYRGISMKQPYREATVSQFQKIMNLADPLPYHISQDMQKAA